MKPYPPPNERLDRASTQNTMTNPRELEHTLKNHLSIILGFTQLLLQDAAPDDPRRGDFEEIHKAASAAVEIVSAIGAGKA
jgi:hypothetical protein